MADKEFWRQSPLGDETFTRNTCISQEGGIRIEAIP